MAQPPMLEVREARGVFGLLCKWAFFGFQLVMILLLLGTCGFVVPFLSGPDPEVAIGAGLFGAMAIGLLWSIWPVGTLVLGLLMILTRGRKRLIPAPVLGMAAPPPGGPWQAPPAPPPQSPSGPPPGRGSVPPTGPRR